ncbi:MAG: hypothetical protein IPN53_21390 [Comamonadaceae bacterium]|nr:hypothetical protein [Comamonadaceae bacterium]
MLIYWLRWGSLKTRVTMMTLGIVLLGMALLAWYVSSMLRDDLERLQGAQQFSVASLAGTGIDRDISSRLAMLETDRCQSPRHAARPAGAGQAFAQGKTCCRCSTRASSFTSRMAASWLTSRWPAGGWLPLMPSAAT